MSRGYIQLREPSQIAIEIYNVLRQKIKTLPDGFQSSSGQLVWDGTKNIGHGATSGLYIYSLKAEEKRVNKKMLLINGKQLFRSITQRLFNFTVTHFCCRLF
jgi:hypothetical protein